MKDIGKKNWEILNKFGITPDNLTVGGSLDLSGTSITALPDNLTVGGWLDLSGTSITSLPDNLTVGGYIYDKDNNSIQRNDKIGLLSWQGGKYIKVDGILSEVLHKKDNIYKVRTVGKKDESYIVTDGEGNYAHGLTIKQANADLMFKLTNRSTDYYKDLDVNKEMSFEDAVICYRVITGACSFGVNDFIERKNINTGDTFSVNKMIKLTKNEYGNTRFKDFFN